MTYRAWLGPDVLRQMSGLPEQALDVLVRALSRICRDPYDRVLSAPLTLDGRERVAELGDSGFIEFTVDESARLVRVYRLAWVS